jgi:hypothetical protein
MKKSPPNRRVAVLTALAGVFAAIVPIVTRAGAHAPTHLNATVFIAGLGVGLAFTLAVATLVRSRRGCCFGDRS